MNTMNTTAAPQTVLYIKNMVCDRCRMAVEQIFRRNDLAFDHIELGKVYLHEMPTADQLTHLRHDLEQVGFELIDDQRSVLVEQIRTAVLDYVGDAPDGEWKLSAYLSDRLAKSYTLLSSAFSAARGMTIERFFILQKVGTRQRIADLRRTDDVGNRISPQLFESRPPERTIQTGDGTFAFGIQTTGRDTTLARPTLISLFLYSILLAMDPQTLYLERYESQLTEQLLRLCTEMGALNGQLLETPDLETVWEAVAQPYVADALPEIPKYPTVAIGGWVLWAWRSHTCGKRAGRLVLNIPNASIRHCATLGASTHSTTIFSTTCSDWAKTQRNAAVMFRSCSVAPKRHSTRFATKRSNRKVHWRSMRMCAVCTHSTASGAALELRRLGLPL